jgi:hypothetical protein
MTTFLLFLLLQNRDTQVRNVLYDRVAYTVTYQVDRSKLVTFADINCTNNGSKLPPSPDPKRYRAEVTVEQGRHLVAPPFPWTYAEVPGEVYTCTTDFPASAVIEALKRAK